MSLRRQLRVRAWHATFFGPLATPRFAAWTLVTQILWHVIWLLGWLGQTLDRLLFPRALDSRIERPLFVLSSPRSGSTFLHRLLCHDEQFTHLKLYQTVFPAVSWYRAFQALPALDRRMGRPLGRLLDVTNRLLFSRWNGIHAAGFERSEEDEVYWLFRWSTPAVAIFFPDLDTLEEVAFADRMPTRERERLARGLRANLSRHLYAEGRGRTLLLKNTLAAGRLRCYQHALPDMRIVHIVRHPYESVPSTLSLFATAWKIYSPACAGDSEQSRSLARIICEYYRVMLKAKLALPRERYFELRYEHLVADPVAAVEAIYHHFGLSLGDVFRARLRAEAERAAQYSSNHAYDLESFGISREWIRAQMPEVFAHYRFEDPECGPRPNPPRRNSTSFGRTSGAPAEKLIN